MSTLAFVRNELVQQEEWPPASRRVARKDWKALSFPVLLMSDYELDEDGFNMLIEHPKSGKIIKVYSIDFDFKRGV